MTPEEFVDSLVAAFASSQSEPYFAHFSPEATFVFHTAAKRLENRGEYEEMWAAWEAEDRFKVLECFSTNRRVQELGDVAIFTHDVRTTVVVGGEFETTQERETIVLQRSGKTWIAVHEHLSAAG